jgi:hypothetical protein
MTAWVPELEMGDVEMGDVEMGDVVENMHFTF